MYEVDFIIFTVPYRNRGIMHEVLIHCKGRRGSHHKCQQETTTQQNETIFLQLRKKLRRQALEYIEEIASKLEVIHKTCRQMMSCFE